MKKILGLLLLGVVLVSGSAFAKNDDWDSYGSVTDTTNAAPTDADKKAVARNIAALAKNPEALKAAANIAKIRMKQKEEAAAAQGF